MAKVSVLDLTVDQVAKLEDRFGPVSDWGAGPKAALYAAMLAVSSGDDEQKYRQMRMRDLIELVSLDEGEDPTPPSGP
jgi:hypothetical protein